MIELRVLSDFRESEAQADLTEGRHTFWSYVDSRQGWHVRRDINCTEDCFDGYASDHCSVYAHQRGDRQCIAANSDAERCATWAIDGAPFCSRHLRRAWEALWVCAMDSEMALLKRDLERVHQERLDLAHTMVGRLGVTTALLVDATIAASRVAERVYFYAADYAVKVGRSLHPEKRVRSLSGTKAPDDIDVRSGSLLGTIPGGCHVESELHSEFSEHRIVGEWFRLEPIRERINELLAEAHAEAGAA